MIMKLHTAPNESMMYPIDLGVKKVKIMEVLVT